MKSLLPWFCLVAAAGSQLTYAANGLEAYRQGSYNLAAKTLPSLASKDPVANYYLGLMRLYGYGELKNDTLALRYFTNAANKGFLPAQRLLANYALSKNEPEEAFKWFKKAAEADDTAANMYCAAAYLNGYGVKKNPEAAKRYYIEASKNGNAIAQYTLAMHFLDSRQAQNKKMGVIWLSKAAAQGNLNAQIKLAELYVNGGAVTKDLKKAKELVQQPATGRDPLAMFVYGQILRKEGDLPNAKEWLIKAADAQNKEAQIALSELYMDKKSPFYDEQAGFNWLLKAAQNGSKEAQKTIAKYYKDGKGVAANPELAKQWEEEAKKKAKDTAPTIAADVAVAKWLSDGKSESFGKEYQLSGIYNAWNNPLALKENNYNPAPHLDTITRQELYQPQFAMVKPADISIGEYFDIIAPTLTSAASMKSSGFPRYPYLKEVENLLRAQSLVLRHEPSSMLIVSTPYHAPDEIKPFNYLEQQTEGSEQKANFQRILSQLYGQAILGDSSAQFELGQLYQYGIGVAKNIPQAITYFQLAAMQQDLRAEYNLGILYLEGQTEPVNYQKGVQWITDAAFKGNPYAQYVLANIYEQGLVDPEGRLIVKPDHEQALAMLSVASSINYGPAQYQLASFLSQDNGTQLSMAAKQARTNLIKRLYQGAAEQGVADAGLPLAFYYAMDTNPEKQAQAFKVAKSEARAGNPSAAILLGLMYERGISVPANQVEAMYWYQQAPNNPVHHFILGTYYSNGNGVSKSIAQARDLLQQSAAAGFAYANFNLAILRYQLGEDFLPELDKARQLGNSKAGLLLADHYMLLANNPDNMKQAREIYQDFANKGDKDAELKLAFLYDKGLGGEQNNELATHWYQLAADQDQPVAQYLLGQLYQLGRVDQTPNYELAKTWYNKAKSNYTPAAVALGFLYETVDNDYNNAFNSYSFAANKQDKIAQYNLGLMYEIGKDRPVDYPKAQELYSKAAEQGYAKAMAQLASIYFRGDLNKRDNQQALIWYRKAANLNDSQALYQLGLLSETGVSVNLDFKKAVSYYQKAANLGNEKAKLALARMYQYGLGVSKNPEEAASLYKELAENNNAYAQYQLATLYFDGSLGERQPEQGQALLKLASDNGNQQARKMLYWMDALKEQRFSYIEPINLNQVPMLAGQTADLMYMDAINEWNRGDETSSRMILNQLMKRFPHYTPAKRTYEQLNQQASGVDTLG
ncbi:enhanced entry protein EnhC [Legionella beliardensis]|uniref:Enhanced entry protein EnhC n=1 Tax=Legionella beliardensis TaxID=91822 RepID=A0A378I2R9_9GAMM|nr:SEL1-like repeat protein [Legionella beliardensis]STX29458.1 enhanced entry protein EnhC [Legionella beliardensis]